MSAPETPRRTVPHRVTGLGHVIAATRYSADGLARLWQETAFRHEVTAFAASAALLLGVGAGLMDLAMLICVFLILFAVEALNTAIECIVDRISPEWEDYARNAKDLGSFAVMCLLLVVGVLVTTVVWAEVFAT